jgi:hypothetical protein
MFNGLTIRRSHRANYAIRLAPSVKVDGREVGYQMSGIGNAEAGREPEKTKEMPINILLSKVRDCY